MKHHPFLLPFVGSILALAAQAAQVQESESQQLLPHNPVGVDKLGQWIAVDGDEMLAGAPESSTTGSGRIHAFHWDGAQWLHTQSFGFLVGGPGSGFGRRLALDGSTAVAANLGSAFVYTRNGSGPWTLQQWIAAPGNKNYYGSALAIDGDTVLVGQAGITASQAWVWTRSGTSWSLQQKLEPPNPPQSIGFGDSLAVVGDTAIVGASTDDQGGGNAGAVFVFTRSGVTWTLQAKLLGNQPFSNRRLGRALSAQLRPGGVIEFAVGGSGPTSGEVLVFEGGGATWTQTARVLPSTTGGWYGSSVSLDGDRLLVGAWRADSGAPQTGLATLYRRCGPDWLRQADLLGSDTVTGDNFGLSVAVGGPHALVGAPFHDELQQDVGAVYVFDLGAARLTPYCAGDGSGGACPCGNEGPGGHVAGCVNSTGAGSRLVLDDALQVSTDELTACAAGLVPGQSALLFAGTAQVAGGDGAPFGDGLRCAGTGVVRLGTQTADAAGQAGWGPGLGALGGWAAGDRRNFQVWYRDPALGPCATGFNLSNGVSALFVP